jgi:ATP-binding cassette subfamily C protein
MKTFVTKLSFLLTVKEKWQILTLTLLMLGSGILEAIGVGLIGPFIYLINTPTIIQDDYRLRFVYNTLGMVSITQLLIWISAGIILFYILKNTYVGFVVYVQSKFIAKKEVFLSTWLFNAYLHKPYTFHLQRNTSELLLKTTEESGRLCNDVLGQSLQLVAEAIIIIFVALLLVVIEPVASLTAVVVVSFITYIFFRAVRKKTIDSGRLGQKHRQKMIQWVNQGLGGIKEIKVLNREAFFVKAYLTHGFEYLRAILFYQVIGHVPRLLLETILILGAMLFLVIMLVQGKDVQTLLPTLSLFAAAAFRMMPSIHRIISSATRIRYYKHTLDSVYEDLLDVGLPLTQSLPNIEVTSPPLNPLVFEKEITLNHIFYQYPTGEGLALKDIDLTINKGQAVGFVGPSGSGKTTLINLLLGLLSPTSGQLLVDGHNIAPHLTEWQHKIGYIPQDIYLSDDTIRRNIAFGVPDEHIEEAQVWAVIKLAQLETLVQQLPAKLDTVVGERGVRLSGGQRQRVAIARALYHQPQVLIMDEATAALDNETEREITQAVERLSGQKTLLIVAHRLSTVKNCDQLYFIDNGQVVASGTYEQLFTKSLAFQEMAQLSVVSR